ncbi:isopeptide-forming domain-containing fimbrial protein [Nodularia sp. UHCC 0506]|uniref:isopeptide-forming domain-containing fimbrial protein n=1 Tax=Nodularia sp. UHCC 0506 TaxID=3110243 RepID=UPI002B1F6745|nr:isopeptide-forming domain-containing fimbrial protein [Nodularia sp. UHCC 0506]MEA5516508.1 isopeptide-forming domain-containing fimbrial protein [Nodularia sp. UHCC 0506]
MTTRMKLPLLSSYSGKLIGSLALILSIWGQGIQPSWAEGSKDLVADGGYRPYLESTNLLIAGILRRTTLKVYVQAGETVNLGSSVPTSSNGTQDIVYTSPFGGQNGACDVLSSGFGFIDTVAKETAGPLPNVGGYTPCSFVATETGVYEVVFYSPFSNPGGNPTPVSVTAQFPTGNTQQGGVAAWDITVRDTGGNDQIGRVFTNYISMNMGGNANSSNPIALNSKLYIQTKDGYRYETDMNGVDPFGFVFFANSRGYIDRTNNSTLYRSAGGASNNSLNFPGNVSVQNPTLPDTLTDITHLVFFNRPDPLTLIGLGLPTTAVLPVEPTSFKFTGGTGGSGNQTPVGVGGYFSFNSATPGSYQIIIDTNNDGVFDPSVDRVLQNPSSMGSNVVLWDGKDANGVNLPPLPGNAPYSSRITARAGEYHFPMLDAENNPLGFKITMENPPGPFSNFLDVNGQQIGPTTIYYNDSNYTTSNGTFISLDPQPGGVATSPRNASLGIDSANGEHEFTGGYGDFKGIGTWTYFSSGATFTPLVVTTNQQANVQGTKSVRFLADNDNSGTVTVGDNVEYIITYSNLGPGNSDAINFVIKDTLPPQLTFVDATITALTSGNNITINSNYNGSGAVTNSGTLRVDDTITIRITATINSSNGGDPISNQASADFNTPDNPSAAVGIVLTDANSVTATTNLPTVGNYFLQITDDGIDTGNNPANTADDDPTLFTVTATPQGTLLLVKRITGVNGSTTNNGRNLNAYIDTTSPYDDNEMTVTDPNLQSDTDQWPIPLSTSLLGEVNGGMVKPGDEIEYTIYFLSTGEQQVDNVSLCDRIPLNQIFLPTKFNSVNPVTGGLPGADKGILVHRNNTTQSYTNVADGDNARFYAAGETLPLVCGAEPNQEGAVVVNLGTLPSAKDNPSEAYGFVRFQAKVR